VLYAILGRFTQPTKDLDDLIEGGEEPHTTVRETGVAVTAQV
jgi:hypothetical protein